MRHLYFHIPFCPKLCPYCCFYVEIGSAQKNTRFLEALLRQVEDAQTQHTLQPETIYFGGGTPSALTLDQLDFLLSGLRARLDLSALREWTFEVNPATIRAEKAALLLSAGITRISLGVQSWNDLLLQTLGRVHDARQAEETYEILRAVGFKNINIDLMFAIPGQTPQDCRETLQRTVALAPEHVSSYCLTYEEDTEYFRQLKLGVFNQDQERDAAFFELTMDTLADAGFEQYEISNYARPGFASAHNDAYWRGADYLGFGPSAFSTHGFERWQTIADTAEYTRRVLAGENPQGFRETLAANTRAGEILAFAIRKSSGIAAEEIVHRPEMQEFFELGLLEKSGARVRLTRRGKMLADSVAEALL